MIENELTPEVLLRAYASGIFPMADEDGQILWFSPDPRAVIELDQFRIPRSLRQRIGKGGFEVRINTCFQEVISRCADRAEGTWLSPQIIEAYTELHRRGHAHSVETYYGSDLAGGLYGVSLAGAFFGESMFTVRSDGSKLALVALVQRLRQRGLSLLDIQFMTRHLARFGAVDIPRNQYLSRLQQALRLEVSFL